MLWLLLTSCILTGCSEDMTNFFAHDEIETGEPVMFTTYAHGAAATRTDKDVFDNKIASYKPVSDAYTFVVEMYKEGETTAVGSGGYKPLGTEKDGSLTATAALYWPDNVNAYAFKATAGTVDLEADQTTSTYWLNQDRLVGYGFEPLWDDVNNKQVDDETALNYRTSKGWYAANKSLGVGSSPDEYKKIPLYLQHQRSLITIKLKAGNGVNPEDLVFEKAKNNITATLYSYSKKDGSSEVSAKSILPLIRKTKVKYDPDSEKETVEYTAVVEPYDYCTNATTDKIAEIKLSEQRFTFCADNDAQHENSEHMKAYSLQAGQHLILTVTLGRDSREVVMSSYLENWTETVTTSIIDDYGMTGELTQITNRKELSDFLSGSENKPGNVAIIIPNAIDLDEGGNWEPQPLNCTLNMGGATFHTNNRLFSIIGSSGNLVNGVITVGNASVASAIAETNYGSVDHIDVLARDASGKASTANATQAGLVVTNSGTITACSSELPVQGTTGFVGGIAAHSVYPAENPLSMPTIDGCSVNAPVCGSDGVKGGGIVGEAVGRVTNNTFTYGITISQKADDFKNIVQSKAEGGKELRVSDNAWPTNAENDLAGTNVMPSQYDGVLDRQTELASLLTSQYNVKGKNYRLSRDFALTDWTSGQRTDDLGAIDNGNVHFTLDGNNKTIITDGMLFSNITGIVKDLTVRLSKDLIAKFENGTDAIAALAYAVAGTDAGADARISNIQVIGDGHRLQASNVGGVAVWAYNGASIENCQAKANIEIWVNGVGDGAKIFAGGIVGMAANATITRCVFHNTDGTLSRNTEAQMVGSENVTPADGIDEKGIYYGGILGGAAKKENVSEEPSVLITDCTSWFITSKNSKKGAIVGYAGDAGSIEKGCEGNWWQEGSDGVGTCENGKSVEQTIGRRNAVTPTKNDNYDK